MVRQVRAVLTVLLLLAVGFGQGVSALAALHLEVAHSGASAWAVESRSAGVHGAPASHEHAGQASHHHHANHTIADANTNADARADNVAPGQDQNQNQDGREPGTSGYTGPHCCTALIFIAPSTTAVLVPPHSGLRHVIRSTSVAPDNFTYPLLRPPRRLA